LCATAKCKGVYPDSANVDRYERFHALTLTGLEPDTVYYAEIVSTDLHGNESLSGEFTISLDQTPPVISQVATAQPTDERVVLTWATDEPSTAVVRYGLASGQYTQSKTLSTPSESHSITFDDLQANRTYYVQIIMTDGNGNQQVGDEFTVRLTTSSEVYLPFVIR